MAIPVRATSVKTPQPTSTQNSTSTGINLQERCLIRDRHRCVVSRTFDILTAEERHKENGEFCTDDDGKLLKDEPKGQFEYLEVTHILPHCLTTVVSGDTELVCANIGISHMHFDHSNVVLRAIQRRMFSESWTCSIPASVSS